MLNGDKSNLVIISRGKKIDDENLCILLFNDVVRPVSKATFLGLEIDESLSFKGHIQEPSEYPKNTGKGWDRPHKSSKTI